MRLEAVLQVRAAYLSEDDRAEAFHRRRPRGRPSDATVGGSASQQNDAQRRSSTPLASLLPQL